MLSRLVSSVRPAAASMAVRRNFSTMNSAGMAQAFGLLKGYSSDVYSDKNIQQEQIQTMSAFVKMNPQIAAMQKEIRDIYLSRSDVQESFRIFEREIALGLHDDVPLSDMQKKFIDGTLVLPKSTNLKAEAEAAADRIADMLSNKKVAATASDVDLLLERTKASPVVRDMFKQCKRGLDDIEHTLPGVSSDRLRFYLELSAWMVGPLCILLFFYTMWKDAAEHEEHLKHWHRQDYPYLKSYTKMIGTGSPCTLLDHECWDQFYEDQEKKKAGGH